MPELFGGPVPTWQISAITRLGRAAAPPVAQFLAEFAAHEVGAGVIGFTALAQGLLTGKYLGGIPEGSRATQGKSLNLELVDDAMLQRLNALHEVATARGQSLAQLALAWALRDPRVTSLVIGASSANQLDQNVAALGNLTFTDKELATIDEILGTAVPAGIDLWKDARNGTL